MGGGPVRKTWCAWGVMLVLVGCSSEVIDVHEMIPAQLRGIERILESDPRVWDAAVVQKGDRVNIVQAVGYGMSVPDAKALAHRSISAVRSENSLLGVTPGKLRYDYYVAVVNPNRNKIVFGLKHKDASWITW